MVNSIIKLDVNRYGVDSPALYKLTLYGGGGLNYSQLCSLPKPRRLVIVSSW